MVHYLYFDADVSQPLSESYGRKPVLIATFIVFTAFTLGTALAPTFAGLIVMRLLAGIGASTCVLAYWTS